MRARKAGFTLIELMVALALFGVIMASAYEFLLRGTRTQEVLDMSAEIEAHAREHMARMAQELRQSGPTCADWSISTAGDSITFNKCLGSDGNTVFWTPAISYGLSATVPGGEVVNGGDDNGNTLVDEQLLLRTEDTATVVAANLNYTPGLASIAYDGMIPSGGLQFSLNGQALTITVIINGWHSASQQVLSATQQTIVSLRN